MPAGCSATTVPRPAGGRDNRPMAIARFIVLSCLVAAAAIAGTEGVVRLVGGEAPASRFPGQFAFGRPFVQPDARVGFRLAPGFTDELYRINESGFRGDPLPIDLDECFTVFCVGDSTTFGWKIPHDGDFPAALARLLRDRVGGRTWVVNGGVPSFTSAQVLAALEVDLPVVRPDIVIVTMPWNDLWYSAVLPWTPSILVPRMPGRGHRWLLKWSAVFRFLVQRRMPKIERNWSAAEALDTFAANMDRIVDVVRRSDAVPVFQTPPFSAAHVQPQGVRFVPTGLQWDRAFLIQTARRYVSRFEAVAADRSVPVVKTPLFIDSGRRRDLFLDEFHPTAAGYARMALALLERLQVYGLLAPAHGS